MILIYIDRGRLPPREVKLRAALSSQVVRRQGKLVAKVDPLLEEILRLICLVIRLATVGGQNWVVLYD